MSKKKYIILLLIALFSFNLEIDAQQNQTVTLHKVKKKDTIFGIARDNNITIEELISANPEMQQPGYELKKGTTITIPAPKATAPQPVAPVAPVKNSIDVVLCYLYTMLTVMVVE